MIMSAAAVRRRCVDCDDKSWRRRGQRQRSPPSSNLDFSPVQVRSHSDNGDCNGEGSVNKLSEANSPPSSTSSRSALSLFTSQSRGRGKSSSNASAALSSLSRSGTFFSLVAFVFVSLLLFSSAADGQRQNLPDLSETSSKPIRVQVGDDINIDCVVKNRNNLTILWKYVNGTQDTLISANMVIVTDDKRVSVTHDSASERWVLQIKYARLQDTGIYRCVVNSNPNVYETRMVMVSVRKTYADVLKAATSSSMAGNGGNTTSITDRSFYECCQTEGVPILCRPLCNINAMISDQTKPYMYTLCYNYMAHIFRCIADGRNHLPCCQRQSVPTLCQPSCTGRYSLEKALDHAICHEHSKTILFCIADGLQVLPEQPQDVSAETVNFTFISLKWSSPKESTQGGTEYKITLKELATFDENWKKANVTPRMEPAKIETLIVSGNATEKLLGPLKRSTMYEIKMIARNKFGESMPTNEIRVVTHSPPSPSSSSSSSTSSMTGEAEDGSGSSRKKVVDDLDNGKAGDPAQVPNLRRCCSAKGVKSDACLKQLCEPFIIEPVEVEESIMCMKYMNTSYKCIEEIRDNTDYETCCEEEGVSAFCKHFCSGKTALLYDFQSQFQCLPYMSSLVSCVLERKGYVTTEPQSVAVSSVHTDWALVMWKPPKKQADTVTKYQVHYRELSEEADDFYFVEVATKSPFLVDKLRSSTRYEVFVTAVNKYGVSRGSTRVLFNTTSAEPDPLLDQNLDMPDTSLGYNETMCCEKAGVQPACLPLCDYHLKMKDLFKLSLFCAEPKTARSILRCLAGGRDHRPCCERRGIDNECFDLCNGMITFTSRDVAAKCSKYDGKIFQCMAEGADTLPGMPLALHAANITATSIGIAWNRSLDELPVTDPTTYQIRYSPLPANTTIPPHPFDDKYSTKLNVSNTRFTLTNLKPNTSYSIYVVSSNQYGNSAPSQVLLVSTAATPSESVNGNITTASIGPPHGLELIRKSITVLVFRWSEPLYSAPDVTFTYNIFFQKVKTLTNKDQNSGNNSPGNHSAWIMMNSNTNVIAIQNLTRNTQYAIAVRARTSTGQLSPISETVLAWTDPSLPLEISQPFIHPFPVIEGSMVTIRCESIGYPVPNMTIYINGIKTKSERTRIVHYSIDYVERNLTAIACQAVNEESRHPVQSFREVNVHFAPTITLYKETKIAQKFSIVMLECEFSGYPKPKTRFLKDNTLVSRFNNSRVFPHLKKPKTWVATLVLHNVDQTAAGNYDCIARNDYGEEKKTLRLMIEDTEHVPKNHTECCQEKGIPTECMFVCTKKDINLFDVYKNQKCLEHLNKYITCAADGSDHRRCCMFREVAPECLHWCAGYKIQKMDYCLVSSARDIMSCFREGNKFLPSPPVNVRVQTIFSDNHVAIEWEDANKNKDATHWYWVYWKKVGTNEMDRDRVEGNAYELSNLEPDSTYEFVVKTSNYHGTSILSDPLVINLGSLRAAYLSSEGAMLSSVALTFFFLLFLFGSIGIVAYFTYRNSPQLFAKFRGANSSCTDSLGVSFENHAYSLEEQNGGIQLQEQNGTGNTSNSNTVMPSNGSNGSAAAGGGGRNGHAGNGEAGLFPNQHPSDQNNNPNARNGGQPRVQIRMN